MAYCELGEFDLAVEPLGRHYPWGLSLRRSTSHWVKCMPNSDKRKKQHLPPATPLRLDPSDPDAYLLLGWALHEPGTLVEGVAAYEKSLELKPGQLQTLAYLGDAYLQLGRLEEAREILSAIGLTPHLPKHSLDYWAALLADCFFKCCKELLFQVAKTRLHDTMIFWKQIVRMSFQKCLSAKDLAPRARFELATLRLTAGGENL